MNMTAETERKPGRLARWAPALTVVPALAVLLTLGTWQVQRLQWKGDLLARQAAQFALPPAAVGAVPDDGGEFRFRRVRAAGTFEHNHEMRVAPRTRKGAAGAHVITPLRLDDGSMVLVNRGWVPTRLTDPTTRRAGQVSGRVVVTGIVRSGGRPSRWVPDNRPQAGAWYYIDIAAMTARSDAAMTARSDAAMLRNFAIYAGPAPNPGGFPLGARRGTRLRNDHLQYALTWYALAVVLVVIYILYHRRRRGPG